MSARYAAVVLYYRAGPVLETTLRRLLAQTVPPIEVVVVDNDSGDGVAGRVVAAMRSDLVRVLALDRNEGYAGGMNAGLAALRSDVEQVLLLTHETALDPDAAQHLVDAVQDGAVAAGPLLRRHRDSSVWSAGGVLDARGGTAHLDTPRTSGAPYDVDWLDGAALHVRRDAIHEAGGFDERFFLYWEDVDVSTRLKRVGPVVCAPRAVAWQETGSTPPYFAARNRIVYWRTHGTRPAVRRAVVSELIACTTDLARRRPRLKDASGRMLGVLDGARGTLRPHLAAVRTAPR